MTAYALEFDAIVNGLMSRDVPRDKAEAAARRQLGIQGYPPAQKTNPVEKVEAVEVRKRLIAFGFKVYSTSQSRPSKVGIGIPDIWFVHQHEPIAGWFEVKRQEGGNVSRAQQEFHDDCVRAGIHHIIGDRFACNKFLADMGLAIDIDGRLEPPRVYRPRA